MLIREDRPRFITGGGVGLDQFSLGGWTKVNSRGLGVRTKVYEGDWKKLHKAGGGCVD